MVQGMMGGGGMMDGGGMMGPGGNMGTPGNNMVSMATSHSFQVIFMPPVYSLFTFSYSSFDHSIMSAFEDLSCHFKYGK